MYACDRCRRTWGAGLMEPAPVSCLIAYDEHLYPTFRPMTVDEAKQLKFGMLVPFRAADNIIRTCKINGRPRRWARRPDEVAVPVRYGARSYAMLRQVAGGLVERLLVANLPLAQVYEGFAPREPALGPTNL